MLVMGLDTSLQRCSVAILRDGAVLSDKFVDMERGHAEHLAPMAAAALAEAEVNVTDLDRVGVVVGPGGFTGVRIALSFARGLGIGTGIEIVGVTSLAALAAGVSIVAKEALIAPVIDARRGQIYAGVYEKGGVARMAPFVIDPKQALKMLAVEAGAAPLALVGSGAALLPTPLPVGWSKSDGDSQIDAKIVARLAEKEPTPSGPPAPLYLRGPDAKPPRPGPLGARLK